MGGRSAQRCSCCLSAGGRGFESRRSRFASNLVVAPNAAVVTRGVARHRRAVGTALGTKCARGRETSKPKTEGARQGRRFEAIGFGRKVGFSPDLPVAAPPASHRCPTDNKRPGRVVAPQVPVLALSKGTEQRAEPFDSGHPRRETGPQSQRDSAGVSRATEGRPPKPHRMRGVATGEERQTGCSL
jgi:hypothetical protein